jgi:hypothetical protein
MQILLTLIRQIDKYKNNLRVHFTLTLNFKIVKLILNQKFKDLKKKPTYTKFTHLLF